MTTRSIRGREEQGVTFVELFFDLVFVFAVTQVTAELAHDLTPGGVIRALIVFWLVWWAWTQYTWTLNEADTEHTWVRLLTLAATGLAFLMALTVPLITEPAGRLFPIAYVTLRVAGLALQWRLAKGDDKWTSGVKVWTAVSSLGLVAVTAAAVLGPTQRFTALGIAAVLDVFAASRAGGGSAQWRLYPGHFAERHGLFVIIVLGESLIAAGVTASEEEFTWDLVLLTVTAVVTACALWWTYFGWVADALEDGFRRQPPEGVGPYARDVYSFAHYPIGIGVVGLAIAIEESILHPDDPLEPAGVAALVIGVGAFIGAAGLALARSGHGFPVARAVAIAALGVSSLVFLSVAAWASMTLAAVIVTTLAITERPPHHHDELEVAIQDG
jgi:low temperature requirement protein LtrA